MTKKYKIPKSVMIQGVRVKVERKPFKQLQKLGFREGFMGLFDGNARSILLNSDMPLRIQFETYLHERVHGVAWFNGASQTMANEINEVMAQSMSFEIMAILEGR